MTFWPEFLVCLSWIIFSFGLLMHWYACSLKVTKKATELWCAEQADCPNPTCGYRWVQVHSCREYIYCPECREKIPSTVDLIAYLESKKVNK